jgi:hypothetical protein
MVGVDNFALDVVEYLAPLLVDPTHTRRAVITQLLEMAEKSVNAQGPRAARPMTAPSIRTIASWVLPPESASSTRRGYGGSDSVS